MKTKLLACAAALSLVAGGAVAADMDKATERAIGARKAAMQLYSFYLGQLGAMAKGEVEYNAEAASAAAASLQSMTTINQSAMWPPGSDTEALGEATRALPAIWTQYPDIADKGKALAEAAAAMATAAGTDLASLQGAIGPVGKACGDCHKEYRAEKE